MKQHGQGKGKMAEEIIMVAVKGALFGALAGGVFNVAHHVFLPPPDDVPPVMDVDLKGLESEDPQLCQKILWIRHTFEKEQGFSQETWRILAQRTDEVMRRHAKCRTKEEKGQRTYAYARSLTRRAMDALDDLIKGLRPHCTLPAEMQRLMENEAPEIRRVLGVYLRNIEIHCQGLGTSETRE